MTHEPLLGENENFRAPAASAAAVRMRRHRERRRDGLRCMTIELRETEIAALAGRGLLRNETRNDWRAVKKAFYDFLDSTLGCDPMT